MATYTDEQVEWAARCLYETGPDYKFPRLCTALVVARIALAGGYVPPPRPVPVRQQMIAVLQAYPYLYGATQIALGAVSDALLAKFDITPKVQP